MRALLPKMERSINPPKYPPTPPANAAANAPAPMDVAADYTLAVPLPGLAHHRILEMRDELDGFLDAILEVL